jgi:hypothetical protein
MTPLAMLFILIALPVLASRGKLYRGAWFGIALLSLIASFGFSSVSTQYSDAEMRHTAVALSGICAASAFGSILAMCFYRKTTSTGRAV